MTRQMKRARLILTIAARMADNVPGWETKSRIDEMELYTDYAEPGYTTPESGVIALGNWNSVDRYDSETNSRVEVSNLPERIGKLFERIGIELEWSDEWSGCSSCGKLIRTQPDSYDYKPSYWINEGEILCVDCIDPSEYLESLEGNHETCCTMFDPSEYGYTQYNTDSYQNGFYPGMNDKPETIARQLRDNGYTRFVFNLDQTSQFNLDFSVYIHYSEMNGDDSEPETDDTEHTDETAKAYVAAVAAGVKE